MTIEAGSLKYESGETRPVKRISTHSFGFTRARRGDTKRQTQTAAR